MNVVGTIEADLQGQIEYRAGGIGPLFGETRAREPVSLDEMLSRALRALRKAGVTEAARLYIDDEEVFVADDQDDESDEPLDNLDLAHDYARRGRELEDALSFYLMLSYVDDEFEHVLTVEGSIDHPADEAALGVLDTASPFDDAEQEEGDAADGRNDDELPDATLDAVEREEALETFLQRLLDFLDKELALADAELEVWTDWEGEFQGGQLVTAPVPSVPGYGGPQV